MDTSLRLLNTSSTTTLNCHLFTTTTQFLRLPYKNLGGVAFRPTSSALSRTPDLSLYCSQASNGKSQVMRAGYRSSPFCSQANDAVYKWNLAPPQSDVGESVDINGKAVTTVVLIGWLGATTKHLKSYVKWYNSRGVNAVTFVVETIELLTYELSRKLDKRMSRLGDELASWVSEKEEDGGPRCLVFHTFSNTGWLVYGSILDHLHSRYDGLVMEKIKGCVVDSGGGDPFSPQVWAAGFAAALSQKRGGSSANPRIVNNRPTKTVHDAKREVIAQEIPAEEEPTQMDKIMLLFLLDKFFFVFLNLPRLNKRLSRTVWFLKEKQAIPQLYLYSTDDKVIPFKSIEMYIKEQRKLGRNVISYNFDSSSHLEHYWNFRTKYSSELRNFLLKHCFVSTAAPSISAESCKM